METNLGKRQDESSTLGDRDAVHVATVVCRASPENQELLKPGDHVEVLPDNRALKSDKPVGIVDPFLKGNISYGDKFLVVLYPNTIVGMKHHWQHPVFDKQDDGIVKTVADKCGKTKEDLIEDAKNYAIWGDYIFDNSERYKDVTTDEWKHFWEYIRLKFHNEHDGFKDLDIDEHSPYTCSC